MNAGQLRNRIKILRREGALDALGQPSKDWVTVGSTWSKVIVSKSDDEEESDREQSSNNIKFLVRFRKSFEVVTNDCRLIHKNHQYIIKSSYRNDNGLDKWLIIEAEHDTERTDPMSES